MFRRRAGSDETESKRSRPLGSAPPTAREEPNVFLSRLYVNRILRRGRNRLGFLPYAASDVLRNRRRTVSSILGVLLAVTFVAGTFIAIDSSARATLDATLAGIPGDFGFYLNDASVNYSLLRSEIISVAGVIDASVYRGMYISEIDNLNASRPGYAGFFGSLGIDPDHPPYMLRDAPLNGTLDLPRGELGLSKGVAG